MSLHIYFSLIVTLCEIKKKDVVKLGGISSTNLLYFNLVALIYTYIYILALTYHGIDYRVYINFTAVTMNSSFEYDFNIVSKVSKGPTHTHPHRLAHRTLGHRWAI